jgi:hypothetical protein
MLDPKAAPVNYEEYVSFAQTHTPERISHFFGSL